MARLASFDGFDRCFTAKPAGLVNVLVLVVDLVQQAGRGSGRLGLNQNLIKVVISKNFQTVEITCGRC